MPKNYCIFAANYLPNLGGVERYTYNLAKKLISNGNRVVVVTSNVYDLTNYEVNEGIEIIRTPCFNVLGGRFPILKYNREFKSLLKILKEKEIDFVVVNTRFYLHSYFGVRFAKLINIQSIVVDHGTNHFTVNNKFFDILGHFYEHIITKMVKSNCSEFYGVSKASMEWLKHFKIDARDTLYNAVDIESINNLLENPVTDYREKFKIRKDDIVVTYTGRLVLEKGILKLIEAVKQVKHSKHRIFLFIAGDGDLYEKVKMEATDTIIALGKIDFPNIVSLLKQTDIFCLPTDYPEGFPTSVLEAVSCRCFVITTTAGGSKEIILNENYGIIMKENSVEEITDSLKLAIDNKINREEAVERAYQQLLESFTWDKVTKKLINIATVNNQ